MPETADKILDFEKRLEAVEEAIAQVTGGDFDIQIPIDSMNADRFTPLETGINIMISDLSDAISESQTRARDLEEKLDLIEQQRKAIEELSTPIIKIWDQVLVLPLIGTLDTRRSQRLTESLLTDIAATQTRVAILDITGVPTVDSAVANHILKTVSAVKLLGADCVITGIRPDVAQTIVHLGVDLSDVETLSNLSEGLKWAFEYLNLEINRKNHV